MIVDCVVEFVVPDDVTFCSLIRGYGYLKDVDWTGIQRILDRMEKEFGMKPTLSSYNKALNDCYVCIVDVYNALLEICAVTNDTEHAEMFIDQMAEESVTPNGLTLQVVKNRRSIRKLVKQLDRELTLSTI